MDNRSLDSLVSEVSDTHTGTAVREFSDFPTSSIPEPAELPKIGGWLVVVALGLLYAAGRLTLLVVRDMLPLFKGEVWAALTTPGSAAYHPNWESVLITELIGNSFFALSAILLFILLLRCKSYLPRLMVVYYLANFLFVVGDYFGASSIPFVAEQSQAESIREIATAFIGTTIWVPYFIISERVKKTFVR